jgi:soluble lytic murein transglycosylase-like protein
MILLGYSTFAAFVLPPAAAQDPTANIKQRIEAAVSKQKNAAASVSSSVDRQTDAVRRQLKSDPSDGFFVLPPPVRTLADAAPTAEPQYEAMPAEPVDSLTRTASRHEGAEPTLIRGVIKQESGFRPSVVWPQAVLGLMQLMPQTAAAMQIGNSFDPGDNDGSGTGLLRRLLDHYDGGLAPTLGASSGGPRRVDGEMEIPGIPATTNYLQSILSLLPTRQMRSLSFDSDADH